MRNCVSASLFPVPEGHQFPQQPQLREKLAFKLMIPRKYLVWAVSIAEAEGVLGVSHKPLLVREVEEIGSVVKRSY